MGHNKPIVGYQLGGGLGYPLDAGFKFAGDFRIRVPDAVVYDDEISDLLSRLKVDDAPVADILR